MLKSSNKKACADWFVAGALALILEAHPELKPDEESTSSCIEVVKHALADSMGSSSQHDPHQGYGQLKANAWLNQFSGTIEC